VTSRLLSIAVPRTDAWAVKFAGAIIFAFALGLSAAIRIPLPFTPVPITLQTMIVILAGAALGVRWGAAAVLGYLAAGILGLPFFTAGSGLAAIAGPTGGYLIGFVAGAAVAGLGRGRRWHFRTVFMAAALAAIYVCGVAHLVIFWGFPWMRAVQLGVAPFVAIDLAKLVVASAIYIPAAAVFKTFTRVGR
jgi:biotin transport system substrate-specific component